MHLVYTALSHGLQSHIAFPSRPNCLVPAAIGVSLSLDKNNEVRSQVALPGILLANNIAFIPCLLSLDILYQQVSCVG